MKGETIKRLKQLDNINEDIKRICMELDDIKAEDIYSQPSLYDIQSLVKEEVIREIPKDSLRIMPDKQQDFIESVYLIASQLSTSSLSINYETPVNLMSLTAGYRKIELIFE
jgi:hypothetical protein